MHRAKWLWWKPEHGRRAVQGATSWRIVARGFASVSHDNVVERFDVTCGSAGSITVDLYNPKALSTPSSPLIIYLPPTGTHLKTQHPSIPPFLFSQYGALASINYRWNIPTTPNSRSTEQPLSSHPSFATYAFPTPLHDTLHAYNYLTTSLLTRFSSSPEQTQNAYWNTQSHRQKQIPRPILIYGSYLGGTLATSLALTESFSSLKRRSTHIIGLIAKNAILDWTEIATTKEPDSIEDDPQPGFSQIVRNQQQWTGNTLHSLKRTLFNNPASCFDHFVSPTLFLYSAGAIPPASWVTADGREISIEDVLRVDVSIPSSASDSDSGSHTSKSPSLSSSSVGSGIGKHISTLDIQTTRAAHLKFPPRDSGLKIPRSLFLTSSSSHPPSIPPLTAQRTGKGAASPKSTSKPVSKPKKKKQTTEDAGITPLKQAEEMARLMRRSIVLHEFKERAMYDSDVDPHAVSEERVQVRAVAPVDGVGTKKGSQSSIETEAGASVDAGEEEAVVRGWIEESLQS